MCTDEAIKTNGSSTTRVELVDNWHARWPSVLESIEKQGQRDALKIDPHGWLSARQVLLVAFDRDEVAGHVCFGIQPVARRNGEQVEVKAEVDAFGVKNDQVDRLLRTAAALRAQELNCRELVWQ
jgi:hypothetical protein